jgi:hypothetical protein
MTSKEYALWDDYQAVPTDGKLWTNTARQAQGQLHLLDWEMRLK